MLTCTAESAENRKLAMDWKTSWTGKRSTVKRVAPVVEDIEIPFNLDGFVWSAKTLSSS
jgi:hypothetical protein